MTKIAILGAGSIGCWIGGHLARGGADVVLIGRARYAAQIAAHGLTLSHFERPEIRLDGVDFATDPAALEGADIVAVCTKSQDTEEAAKLIARYAPTAIAISFQNGIRNPDLLSQSLPLENIVPAIVPFNVTPTGAGRFHCGTAGPLVIASDPRLMDFTAWLDNAGQDVLQSENIIGDQWAKMIVNLNNGLNTLSGGTLREGLVQRDYRRALADCVEEALGVAEAVGVNVGTFNGRNPSALVRTLRLPNFAYRLVMQLIVKIDAQARSSMLDDLEAGRSPEIEYLQGEIVRQAESVGRHAPKNAAIKIAVEAAFASGKSPHLSGTDILDSTR